MPFCCGSFARGALSAGCRAYIGTHWELELKRSLLFLTEFIDGVCGREKSYFSAFGGAIALNLLFDIPLVLGGLIVGLVSLALLRVQSSRGQRPFEFVIMALLAIIAIGFLVGLFFTDTQWGEAAEGLVEAFAGGHAPLDREVDFLGGGLASDQVEGVKGGEFELFVRAFADDFDGQEAVAEGDARAAGFAEREGDFGGGDAIEPFQAEVVGEFPHVGFLIDHAGVEQVVDGGALALGGGLEHFAQGGEVVTAGSAGGFEENGSHGEIVLRRKTAGAGGLSVESGGGLGFQSWRMAVAMEK